MRKTIWLGLLLTSAFAATVYSAECDSLSLITVRGEAIVSVPPDRVVLALGLESRAEKLENAKNRVDSLMAVVKTLADQFRIPSEKVRTDYYVILPANAKRSKHFVRAGITVTITDLTIFNQYLSGIVEAGVDEVRSVNFELADPLAVRIKVREQAAEAARRKAESIIRTLGATLGRVHSVVDTPGPDYPLLGGGRSSANLYVAKERATLPEGDESSITVGQIEERATVEVSFEIAQ